MRTGRARRHADDAAVFLPLFERELARFVRSRKLPANLRDAIEYSALDGGKRLRPTLAALACRAVGGSAKDAIPAAIAVELVHCFSLVHDDLPALDNDDLRRGKPTLHIHAGHAMAILAGDCLLTLAFEALTELAPGPAVGATMVRELASATSAMIAGQVYDTLGGLPATSDVEKLLLIHRQKTGALILAAARMGAMCAPRTRGREQRLAAITRYAKSIGLMFQIVDDLIDVTQSAEHAGKRTRKDADAGKLTYPSAVGVERARAEVRRLQAAARRAATSLGPGGAALVELADAMAIRTK